jgi:hypothetical protein
MKRHVSFRFYGKVAAFSVSDAALRFDAIRSSRHPSQPGSADLSKLRLVSRI